MVSTNIIPRGNGGRRDLSPWGDDPFEALQEDMDRLMGRFWAPTRFTAPSLLRPEIGIRNFAQMDVRETENAIDIKVDVPGMEVKDIDVTLSDSTLSIKGERETEAEEKREDYYRLERSSGTFHRRIELPTEVDESKIEATVKQGVLSLHLPKSARAREHEKKIKIKSS